MKYTDKSYDRNWSDWIDIAERQRAKDAVLFPRAMRWFADGPVLELGAGVGQLSRAALEAGFDVTASDYEAKFVEHMNRTGLRALQVDARDIARAAPHREWATIFGQGVSPFVTRDFDVVEAAYRSVHESLRPGGRFVLIVARSPNRERFSRIAEHAGIIERVGFVRRARFRNQVLPSRAYRYFPTDLLDRVLGPVLGHRDVNVLEKP